MCKAHPSPPAKPGRLRKMQAPSITRVWVRVVVAEDAEHPAVCDVGPRPVVVLPLGRREHRGVGGHGHRLLGARRPIAEVGAERAAALVELGCRLGEDALTAASEQALPVRLEELTLEPPHGAAPFDLDHVIDHRSIIARRPHGRRQVSAAARSRDDGDVSSLRTPGPQEIAAAVLVDGGRVLMCHRHPSRRWYPDIWDLPGGHIEPDETPEQALVRELREELGIIVDPTGLDSSSALTPEPGLTIHVWVVRAWSGEVSNLAPEEHDELGWFTPVEVAELELPDRVLVDLCRDALASTPVRGRLDP